MKHYAWWTVAALAACGMKVQTTSTTTGSSPSSAAAADPDVTSGSGGAAEPSSVAPTPAPPTGMNPDQARGVAQATDELKPVVESIHTTCGAPIQVKIDWASVFTGMPPEGSFRDAETALDFGRACVGVAKTLSAQCKNPAMRAPIARDVTTLTCRFKAPTSGKKKKDDWAMSLDRGELVAAYHADLYAGDWLEQNLAGAADRNDERDKRFIAEAEKRFRADGKASTAKACGADIPIEIDWSAYPEYVQRDKKWNPGNYDYDRNAQDVAHAFAARFVHATKVIRAMCKGTDGASPQTGVAIRRDVTRVVGHWKDGQAIGCAMRLKEGVLDITCDKTSRDQDYALMDWLSKALKVDYTRPPPREDADFLHHPKGGSCELNQHCDSLDCNCLRTGRNGACTEGVCR